MPYTTIRLAKIPSIKNAAVAQHDGAVYLDFNGDKASPQSFVLLPDEARAVAASLVLAADELERSARLKWEKDLADRLD